MKRSTEQKLTAQDWLPATMLYDHFHDGDQEFNRRFNKYLREEPSLPFGVWMGWQVVSSTAAILYPIGMMVEYFIN